MDKKEMLGQLNKTNSDLSLPEIEGLLYELNRSGGIESADLIANTGIPQETMRRFCKSISPYLQPEKGNLLKLTLQSQKLFDEYALKPHMWSYGDLLEIDNRVAIQIEEFRHEYKKIAKREWDQFYAKPDTSVRKSQVLIRDGLVGKNIALLGDDDLVSLALVLMGAEFSSLTVFDIDKELLAFIKEKSAVLGNNKVHTVLYDCRDNLGEEFTAKYDVVLTDPPYTKTGVELFLNRSIELLGGSEFPGKMLYLFYGNSIKTPEKFLKIQDMVSQYNLLIEDKIDKFARYIGAESMGSASSLYVLKTTSGSNFIKEFPGHRKIYTYESGKEEKFPFVDHVTFKLFGVGEKILRNKKHLTSLCNQFCKMHKLKVMDLNVTEFRGGGLTLVYVLGSSNMAVHTWPELGALHIDLVTCSPIYRKDYLSESVFSLFSPSGIDMNFVE